MVMRPERKARTAFVVAATVILSSCAMFDGTARIKDPAAIDILYPVKDGATITEAVTSDRRIVVYRGDKMCAEAPPDTASNISAAYSGALDASLKAAPKEIAPAIKAGYAAQLATALASVTNPSQGILYMRFVMAAGCTAYINGAISREEYLDIVLTAMSSAMQLTIFELDKNGGKIGGNVVAVNETAPQLSGATVTLEQMAQAAKEAAVDSAGGAGNPAAKAAAKAAVAEVEASAPADNSVEASAAVAGDAAHNGVFKMTQSAAQANKARALAIRKIYARASANVAAAPRTSRAASTSVPTHDLLTVMTTATAPLTALAGSGYGAAAAAERDGFQALLDRDVAGATKAFDAAYQAAPSYHNVYEIRKLLHSSPYSKMQPSDEANWQALYSIILSKYSWGLPDTVIKEMHEKGGH